jgi:hypothetical protein
MQIAIPPSRWGEADRLQLTDAAKQLFINGGESNPEEHPRYDQDTVLYCIKPNLVSAIMQEPLSMAFNGDSYVGPDQQGFCTVGQSPSKAIAGKSNYGYNGLLVMPDSWRLSYGAIEYSAFKGLYSTTHETGGPRAASGVGSSFNNVVFVGPNTLRQRRYPLIGDGKIPNLVEGENEFTNSLFFGDYPFAIRSEDEAYFRLAGSPVGKVDPFAGQDPIPWFDKGRLEYPGIYLLKMVGRLRVDVSDPEISALPITLTVKLVSDSDQSIGDLFQGATMSFVVQRYVKDTDPLQFGWPKIHFEMNVYITFIGTRGRLVLDNLSSPFIGLESGSSIQYLLTRLQFQDVFQQSVNSFGRDVLFGTGIVGSQVGSQFFVPYLVDPNNSHRVIFYPDE